MCFFFHKKKTFIEQSLRSDSEVREYLENTAGKGENAGNQHFLLFPQRFLSIRRQNPFIFIIRVVCKLSLSHYGRVNNFLVWQRVKMPNKSVDG